MTPKLIDLSNKRYGRLMVLRRGDDYIVPSGGTSPQWICICDCGTEVIVQGKSLRKGISTSCGCYHLEDLRNRKEDLSGMTFGNLTVIEEDKNRNTRARWICKCKCGKTKSVTADKLKSGKTTSCGCIKNIHGNVKDIVGNKYGFLIVVALDHIHPNKGTYWKCICECGNTCVVGGHHLRKHLINSCGCLNESMMAHELKIYFVKNSDAIAEYRIVKNPKTNHYLPYDLYLPRNDVFIEIHGAQHYSLNSWHKRTAKKFQTTPKEEFEYQQYKDQIKKEYAKKHGTYIEIDIRKIKTIEQAIDYIEGIINANN